MVELEQGVGAGRHAAHCASHPALALWSMLCGWCFVRWQAGKGVSASRHGMHRTNHTHIHARTRARSLYSPPCTIRITLPWVAPIVHALLCTPKLAMQLHIIPANTGTSKQITNNSFFCLPMIICMQL
eukprot:1149509-Pelagomonas_calceolata.AAC.3